MADEYPTSVQLPIRAEDIRTGMVLGRWRVLHRCPKPPECMQAGRYWMVRCCCKKGTERPMRGSLMSAGHTKSCGCLSKDTLRAIFTKHGQCRSITYSSWSAMTNRCYSKSNKYYYMYGGRPESLGGPITICERWRDFRNFFADMGERPSKEHSLDRFPNGKGNYEPGNVRWATRSQQARNTGIARRAMIEGRSIQIHDLADMIGVSHEAMSGRYDRGLRDEQLVADPPRVVPACAMRRAADNGIKPATVYARLSRYGFSLEEAISIEPRPWTKRTTSSNQP